ncbi:MAG: hypothetical protein ABI091_26480 [Ferruginibacter sp.]
MSNCLNCGKPLVHKEGRRKKEYCNSVCRRAYWIKNNPSEEPQYVKYSTFKELKEKYDILASNKSQQEPENGKVGIDTKKEENKAVAPENASKYNPYGFGEEKWLVIENYSKYPLKQLPKEQFLANDYLKKKNISDAEIKVAWTNFKNL